MALDIRQAEAMIAQRDAAFTHCDMDRYLAVWADDCSVEGPGYFLANRQALKDTIAMAWELMQPLHFETKTLGVHGDILFHEFVLLWEPRDGSGRFAQSGFMHVAVDVQGKWTRLREYFDPQEAELRESTRQAPGVKTYLGDGAQT